MGVFRDSDYFIIFYKSNTKFRVIAKKLQGRWKGKLNRFHLLKGKQETRKLIINRKNIAIEDLK